MQGNPSLNGHWAQLQQYLADYVETEQWLPEALAFLAQFRDDPSLWALVMEQAEDARVYPLDLEKAVDAWQAKQPGPKTSEPILLTLADVNPTEVEWLWKPYIPRGKLTILEGDPEVGKTWLSLAIAAAITQGWPLPGAEQETPGPTIPRAVIYMQAEDGVADTIRPRFDAAGGDAQRLLLLRGKRALGSDNEQDVTLQDLDVIETVLMQEQPAMMIIDPLQAYLGASVDMNRANHIRPLLSALGRLAEQYQCAMLCIRHLSKAQQDRSLYRGLGSIDFAAAARSVLLAGFEPEDLSRGRRILGHSKSSLEMRGPSLSYELREGVFRWLGQSSISVEDLLIPYRNEEERSDLEEAAAFLVERLTEAPAPAKQVVKEAKEAGISERTLRRARSKTGVESWREAATSGGQGRGQWVWGFKVANGSN